MALTNKETIVVVAHLLPCCGMVVDRVSQVKNEGKPGPGDITLCSRCHFLLVFGDDLLERLPTAEETAVFSHDQNLRELLAEGHRIIEEQATRTERGLR